MIHIYQNIEGIHIFSLGSTSVINLLDPLCILVGPHGNPI